MIDFLIDYLLAILALTALAAAASFLWAFCCGFVEAARRTRERPEAEDCRPEAEELDPERN